MATCTALERFLQSSVASECSALLNQLSVISDADPASIIDFYKQAILFIDQHLWSGAVDDTRLADYQAVFRELELHIAQCTSDKRHHIILYIPVADRPRQLTDCLDSLLQLCQLYMYGGMQDNRFKKITVLIGDDSKDTSSIVQHQEIVQQFQAKGLDMIYFGQTEQLQQLADLSEQQQQALTGVLGEADPTCFYHKGSPRMRNIAHLKLQQIAQAYDRVLFYSLDSDQEFQVKISTAKGERDTYALNYFYYLNEIFNHTDTCILTGKVVGDPPVSPAVMAGNFLEDITGFIEQMSALERQQACQFHTQQTQKADDAAYHDMAEMFGFKRAADEYHYPCPVSGTHDNGECFKYFARQLQAFFYGEHPTRKTYYEHTGISTALTPARTVYPGNYVFNKEGLKYFIPFAPLKLRMNGPVMGRVVKALLQNRFVSANLPMLHKRTVANTGQSEFRPDIHQQAAHIDLSGEFERQYFGDVMLFSMEKLTAQGFPSKVLDRQAISLTVKTTEQDLQHRYRVKHTEIMRKLEHFKTLLQDEQQWWNQSNHCTEALALYKAFADNIEHNYGDNSCSYQLINSATDKRPRMTQIINAIMHYPAEQQAWQDMMSAESALVD